MPRTVAMILAGGEGRRLSILSQKRAKPAVPFAGKYRIVDFALSNCLNSGLRRMLLLTQYKAMSLDRHINLGWQRYFCRELGEFIDVVPPQQRIDEQWYQGTADAVYQNIYAIERRIRARPPDERYEAKDESWQAPRKIERYFSQPFYVAQQFTGTEGRYVPLKETVRGFREILDGKHDDLPESAFYMVGTIDQAVEKAERMREMA